LRPAPCASGGAPCFPNRIPIRAAGLAAPLPLQFFSPVFSQPLGAIPVSGPADFYVSGTACQPPAVAARVVKTAASQGRSVARASKVRAGTDAAITRFYFYNPDSYFRFLDDVRKLGWRFP
jgi:hypothetical protein